MAVIWHWISGWGLVTIHAEAVPLAKIVRSIERQGGVKIATNAPGDAPVSMDVDRVTPAQALDTLAAYLDANWSVTYVAGPSASDVTTGVAVLTEGERNPDYRRFSVGGWGMDFGDSVIDARRVVWAVSPSEKGTLQDYVDQLTQKTGVAALLPTAWDPGVTRPPKGGPAGEAMKDLIEAAKGRWSEVFVLRVRTDEGGDRSAQGGAPGGRPAGSDGGFDGGGPPGGGWGGESRADWTAERALARIEQLPAAERETARRDYQEMQGFFDRVRALPEAERRQEMEKFFNDPKVQERMLDRMLSRDAKRSPEKRAERFRRYVERKAAMKAAGGNP